MFKKYNLVIKILLLKLDKIIIKIIRLLDIRVKKYFILLVKRQRRKDSNKYNLIRGENSLLLYQNYKI